MSRPTVFLFMLLLLLGSSISCTTEDPATFPGDSRDDDKKDNDGDNDGDEDGDEDDGEDEDDNDDDGDEDDGDGDEDDGDNDKNPLNILEELAEQTMFSTGSTGAAEWLYPEMYVNDVRLSRAKVASLMDKSDDDSFPVITIYQCIHCGNLDIDKYLDWIEELAILISEKPGVVTVVIEPDSFLFGMRDDDVQDLLDDVCGIIGENAENAGVFLDVGHSAWVTADGIWNKVKEYDNLDHIDGFALNTSNFQSIEAETQLARDLFELTDKPSIVDSSRNGCGVPSSVHNPDEDEWCPGEDFSHHSDEPALLFNYHNKPWNEED